MNSGKIYLPSVSDAKREAGDALALGGNRLLLIEAILVIALNVPLYAILQTVTALCGMSLEESGASEALLIVLSVADLLLVSLLMLFLTLPMILGLFGLAQRIAQGEHPVLSDLFAPFSSRQRYARTLHLAWGAFWRLGLTVAVAYLTSELLIWGVGNVFPWTLLRVLLVIVEIALGLLLTARSFSLMAIVLPTRLSVREARMLSRNMAKHAYSAAFRFFFGFFWWLVLGVLTFGVLLLWDVLPRMTVAYFRYLDQIPKTIIHSEE